VHARYRYRIAAGPGTTNPNLWLVHYRPAEPQHRLPAGQIPLAREVHAQLQMRSQLQAAGPLMRKEFMLHDQANWPKVEFGQQAMRQQQQQQQQPYYNPMQPGRPYAAQPPPAKRQRPNNQSQARVPLGGSPALDTSLEEEENATQDAFDFLTPREISLSRYKQHHEWMEEIFSSPYAVGTIAPIDLGLGLMGELAPLTAGILDVSGADNPEGAKGKNIKIKNYYKLDPKQLEDFDKRVEEYTTKEQAEIDKMKADHAKKMAHLKRTRTYIKAERRLRDLSRSADDSDDSDPVEEVVQDLEKSLNVSFDAKKSVVCVEKGGFIEAQIPSPPKAQVNGNGARNGPSNGVNNDGIVEIDNSAASLLDQYGSGSLTGTPIGNVSLPRLSQPPSQSQSAMGTPNAASNMPQASTFDQHGTPLHGDTGDDLLDLDVEMSGMPSTDKGDEWGLLNEQAGVAQGSGNPQPTTNTNLPTTNAGAMPSSNIDAEAGSMFDTADFGSFDNLDTAGDALAEYGNDDTMGLDLVDDSAFGDAFHGTEMHHDETVD
jgi:hypothetical protein